MENNLTTEIGDYVLSKLLRYSGILLCDSLLDSKGD